MTISNSITIGQYIPGDTFMHRLDPRCKLLALLMFIVAIFMVNKLLLLIPFFLLAVLLHAGSRIPFRFMVRGLKPIIYIIALTLFLHVFFTRGGRVLFRYGPVTIESVGVEMGLFTVFRLILLILFTMLVTLTTTPLALTGGMEYFLRPLKYLKIPVAEIAMILTIALRFIPVLMEESERIIRAQTARGANFKEGHILKRIRFLVPVMIPLFVSAFRRADELAVAMEARCYRVGGTRSSLHEQNFGRNDYVVIVMSALVVAVTVSSRMPAFWS